VLGEHTYFLQNVASATNLQELVLAHKWIFP